MSTDVETWSLPVQGRCGWCGRDVVLMDPTLTNDAHGRRLGMLHLDCARAIYDAMTPPPTYAEQRRLDRKTAKQAAALRAEAGAGRGPGIPR